MRFEAKNVDGKEFLLDNEKGVHYPMEFAVAKDLCILLDKLTAKTEPNTIEEYYQEWEKSINELHIKSKELIDLKESYAQLEQDIVNNTDFKELYGANNQKVRDTHVKNELKDLVDKKHDLEFEIDFLRRRIEFIKSLMAMQKCLIESEIV